MNMKMMIGFMKKVAVKNPITGITAQMTTRGRSVCGNTSRTRVIKMKIYWPMHNRVKKKPKVD